MNKSPIPGIKVFAKIDLNTKKKSLIVSENEIKYLLDFKYIKLKNIDEKNKKLDKETKKVKNQFFFSKEYLLKTFLKEIIFLIILLITK
ncbi:hypothetical protein K9M42_01160 [Patescibacteria group bacterium]|nr:hypothetical protein [Patescibacteria group bacterium]